MEIQLDEVGQSDDLKSSLKQRLKLEFKAMTYIQV